MHCVVGGTSALDLPALNTQGHGEAREFVLSYGYDLDDPSDSVTLTILFRRALALIREELLVEGESIPDFFENPDRLGSLHNLLVLASRKDDSWEQKWACAILRVLHVFVHLRNDLFSAFRDEIQSQVLQPFQASIRIERSNEGRETITLGPGDPSGEISLFKYETKPFKTTASSVVKLLAHKDRVALTLLDKLGVRFVTRNPFDSFRVVRYLLTEHLVSFPHIIPDQSNNTIYPLNLFLEAVGEWEARDERPSATDIQAELERRLQSARDKAQYLDKANEFSDPDYRFIKFITRKLITAEIKTRGESQMFRFFYPFEVQIMDVETWEKNLAGGPMAHDVYKAKQRQRARLRVFGVNGPVKVP
jgi:uncharacterized protein (TIGR04562 family)